MFGCWQGYVNSVARNGVYHSRMSSCGGRNVQRYRLHLHDVLRRSPFDDTLYVGRPTNDMSLSYDDVKLFENSPRLRIDIITYTPMINNRQKTISDFRVR